MTTAIRPRLLARTAAAAALAGALLLAGALPASAHVHVEADDATGGGFAVLTFRVPNESDTAGTVAVAATLPADTPFLSVSVRPVPGWTATTSEKTLPKPVEVEGTTITKAVRTVTWRADRGSRIGPGQFEEFALSVGPLPASGTIAIPVAQTYSDGTVVEWDQPTPASGDEPEHPVPTFTIEPAADQSASPTTSPAAPTSGNAQPVAAAAGASDPLARVLGGLGLLAGVVALVVALAGRRRGAA